MISSKPRLVVPYGLKTLLEGISRAVLKTSPQNITQFAAVYFKELIVFREVEKWSEGTTQEKKPECIKESEETSTVSQEPTRMEKSTDTEEDNIAGPQFINKTTQFPSVHAELPQEPEVTIEAVSGPSTPSTPKIATPPSSPCPAAVSPEVAYVPADPAQFAAQMLGKVSSVHYDQSDVLMVDVATSMPVFSNEVLSSEAAEDNTVAASVAYSDERVARQVVSQTSGHVDLGSKPKDNKAEPSTASLPPLQDEQEPPAHDQAPEVPFQAGPEVTSAIRISSVYKDEPVTEGVTYIELMPEQVAIPLPEQAASLKENELLPPVSSTPILKTDSGTSEKSVGSAKFAQLEDAKLNSSVYVEGEATVLISDTFLKGPSALSLDAEGSTKVVGSEKSLHLEVEIVAVVSEQEKSRENSASQEMGVNPVLSGEATKTVHSGTSVRSSSGPPPPGPENLTEPEIEPEWEAAPEQGLMESGKKIRYLQS
uniref:Calcium-binding tyrosine phosphorylation-regulated protein n=1 Tax=Rousettus aegyptiacus TaxID=9407 RepID=A0A7J8DFX7_ROUAE|nr:calcium binding tyrosine phosphorylation regulated [Rousettus aegyptiacus]